MIKKLTCIECPQGCQLTVDVENGYVIKVTGQKCPRGDIYAKQEIENPLRTLISTVVARGLSLKMVPVKTSKPMPKTRLIEGMQEVRKVLLKKPVQINEIIQENFLGLELDLIATRTAHKVP